jgi:hypothetical protein
VTVFLPDGFQPIAAADTAITAAAGVYAAGSSSRSVPSGTGLLLHLHFDCRHRDRGGPTIESTFHIDDVAFFGSLRR